MVYTPGLLKNPDFSPSAALSYSLGSTGSLSSANTPRNVLMHPTEGLFVDESFKSFQSPRRIQEKQAIV